MSDKSRRFADEALQSFHDEFVDLKESTEKDRECLLNALTQNTAAIKAQAEATNELVTAWRNARGFIWVVKKISQTVVALIPIGVFFGALWYFMKTGHWSDGS